MIRVVLKLMSVSEAARRIAVASLEWNGSIPFLQKYLAIENRGYKTEVRLRGLN
jgi:hypothetical protein